MRGLKPKPSLKLDQVFRRESFLGTDMTFQGRHGQKMTWKTDERVVELVSNNQTLLRFKEHTTGPFGMNIVMDNNIDKAERIKLSLV